MRETTAPGDVLFKRYRNKYDTIREKINYGVLNSFEWPQADSFMYKKAQEVLELVMKMLEENKFTRGDYKELAVLVYVFLSGRTDIGGKQFKFSLHHNISHARFMQRCLNYIMMSVEDKTIIARATWDLGGPPEGLGQGGELPLQGRVLQEARHLFSLA